MTPITGAIYARISLDRKGEELGVKRQVKLGRGRAERDQIDVPDDLVIVDNSLSAMNPKVHREGYAKLLDLVRADKVKVVIVYQSSRLWRNKRERLDGQELFKRHGVRVLCVREMDLEFDTAGGMLFADMIGAVNSWESAVKSERMMDEHWQRATRGLPPLGPRLFGYAKNGWDLVENEAEAVADAFKGFVLDRNLTGLFQRLNERGLRTGQGNPWSTSSARKLLRNERYCGLRALGGEMYPGRWPIIVSESQWQAACGILADPSRRSSFSTERKHLGSNLYRCGACELAGRVTTLRPASRGDGERTYRCRASGHLVRTAEPIDLTVELAVVERLSRADAVELLVDDQRPDAETLQLEAIALRQRMADIAALLGRGVMTAGQFETANREAQSALEVVTARMQDAQRAPLLGDLVSASDVLGAWRATPLARQRRVVDTLMTVTVLNAGPGRRLFDPATVRIDWK